MRLRLVASAVIVLGILFLASVALANYPDEGVGVGSTETWVMNVHETLDANVVASFFDQDGQQTWSTESTIAPLGNDSFPASSSQLQSGWLGSMSIDSLRPIASIAETIWQNVPQGDGWSATTVNDTGEGAHEIFFPSLVKSSYHRSILTIQCVDTEDCLVSMTYRGTEGDVITGSPFLDTIEASSQETYDLWDPSVNPHIPEQQYTPSAWYGSLQVTSTGEIAGVCRTHSRPGYASAYNAVPRSTEAEVFFPGVVRRNFGGSWGGESDWSGLNIMNPNNSTNTVYLNFYKSDGTLVLRFDDDIPAGGSHSYSTRYGTQWPFEDLGDRFIGSAVATSTLPMVAMCSIVRAPSDGLAGAYHGVSTGYSKLVFPVAYRVKEGTAWRHYTGITIQNVDPENAISVHLSWRDSGGAFKLQVDDTIPPYASHGYNTRYGGTAYEALGPNFKGTVIVTTDSPLGVAGVICNQSTLVGYQYISQYNGVPVE